MASRANNETDLINIVEQVRLFGAPLKYDNRVPYGIALGALVIPAVVCFWIFQTTKVFSNLQIILMVCLVLVGIVSLGFVWWRSRSIKNLSQTIYAKDVLFDNQLSPVQVNSSAQAKMFGRRFKEFNRGNHRRDIESLYDGQFAGSEHQFPFQFYHFHYVDKRIVTRTTTNSKGQVRTTTHTEYDHYHRYGLIMPFSYARDIAVLSGRVSGISGFLDSFGSSRDTYKPSSNRFNKTYTVYTQSEMAAAKFLEPAVVTAFEEIATAFKGLNFEFNSDGDLCMSFKDNDVVSFKRTYGLDQPAEFIAELKQQNTLDKLNKALEHIHILMKHSDNNFGWKVSQET